MIKNATFISIAVTTFVLILLAGVVYAYQGSETYSSLPAAQQSSDMQAVALPVISPSPTDPAAISPQDAMNGRVVGIASSSQPVIAATTPQPMPVVVYTGPIKKRPTSGHGGGTNNPGGGGGIHQGGDDLCCRGPGDLRHWRALGTMDKWRRQQSGID